jgi:hypothetical protein
LLMMARMSMGSRPLFQRNSRSFRQWPSLLTMSTVLHGLGRGMQAPAHLVGLCKGGQAGLQGGVVVLVAGKLHPHEKQARGVVVVLGGFFDVAAMLQQKTRDGVHQPQAVGARESKDVELG